ncbi:hypothetical protein FRC04_011234 [Tulasnella sp. 424]|nr:hypothetical protein FRC04_011234 [Tulasnella sp. 424]
MTNSEPESANRDVSDNESQNGPATGDDGPDLEFLLEIGGEICRASRYVWNNIGSNWNHAKGVLRGENPELQADQDESDSTYEEDPSYTPVYRFFRLSRKESLRDSPEPSLEPEPISIITDKPAITYHMGLLDLPYELLAGIIQLVLQEDPHVNMTMSHVNSALRSLTLSASSLWTTIDIMFPNERIQAHLERSGSSLLQVRASLVFLTTGSAHAMRKLDSFKDMIKPHAARIASLEMRYANAAWNYTALARFLELGPFSSLDEFEYGLLLHQPFPTATQFRFNCKPKRIRLEGLPISTFLPIYSARVISLKVTETWEGGFTHWREALRMMPSLQNLELSDFNLRILELSEFNPGGPVNSIDPISLPHLQTLSLVRVPRAVLGELLSALQTPSLVSVTITFLEPDGLHEYNPIAYWTKPQPTHGMSEVVLLPFVSANPQLEELDLQNCCMTPDMWTTVFSQLRNLKKLRIASSDVTGEALASLVVSPGSSPALPFLTHITLDNESLDKESDLFFPFIDELITTRWNLFQQQQVNRLNGQAQIVPLQSVVLRGWDESHIPPIYRSTELNRLRGYIEYLHLETFQINSDDDGEATDGEWETQSEGSWASGDQAVVDLGTRVHSSEWGMELAGVGEN